MNPCETHKDFVGDLCPVCLMEERNVYRKDREILRTAIKEILAASLEEQWTCTLVITELCMKALNDVANWNLGESDGRTV